MSGDWHEAVVSEIVVALHDRKHYVHVRCYRRRLHGTQVRVVQTDGYLRVSGLWRSGRVEGPGRRPSAQVRARIAIERDKSEKLLKQQNVHAELSSPADRLQNRCTLAFCPVSYPNVAIFEIRRAYSAELSHGHVPPV